MTALHSMNALRPKNRRSRHATVSLLRRVAASRARTQGAAPRSLPAPEPPVHRRTHAACCTQAPMPAPGAGTAAGLLARPSSVGDGAHRRARAARAAAGPRQAAARHLDLCAHLATQVRQSEAGASCIRPRSARALPATALSAALGPRRRQIGARTSTVPAPLCASFQHRRQQVR